MAGQAPGVAPESCAEVALEAGEVGIEELAPWDHQHVHALPGRRHVQAEDFSNQSLGPISYNGSPDLPARDDAQTRTAGPVRGDDQGEVTAVAPDASGKRLLELRMPTDPPVSAEPLGLHVRMAFAGAL
jgi:hypothetical protein